MPSGPLSEVFLNSYDFLWRFRRSYGSSLFLDLVF
jgi:hypothetical protein